MAVIGNLKKKIKCLNGVIQATLNLIIGLKWCSGSQKSPKSPCFDQKSLTINNNRSKLVNLAQESQQPNRNSYKPLQNCPPASYNNTPAPKLQISPTRGQSVVWSGLDIKIQTSLSTLIAQEKNPNWCWSAAKKEKTPLKPVCKSFGGGGGGGRGGVRMKGRNEKSRDDICFTPKRVCSHAVDLAPKPPPPAPAPPPPPPPHPAMGLERAHPVCCQSYLSVLAPRLPTLHPVRGPSKTWEGGESWGQGDTC